MPQKVRIALDAMGGDHGPSVVVPGAEISLTRHPDTEFILFGDSTKIDPLLAAQPRLKHAAKVVHTDVAVRMDDKPSQAKWLPAADQQAIERTIAAEQAGVKNVRNLGEAFRAPAVDRKSTPLNSSHT